VNDFAGLIDAPSQPCHAVQFYDDDVFLVESMTRYVETGVRAGEGAIVLATRGHIDALADHVDDAELLAGIESGRVVLLDAERTLAQFIVGGAPDRDQFRRCVATAVDACHEAGAVRVRAFGEMVDILWKEGAQQAALAVETYWEEICNERGVALRCAYAMDNFPGQEHTARFEEICARHRLVIPTEGRALSSDPRTRGREIAVLQQRARALEAEAEKRRELEHALRDSIREQRRAENVSRVRSELLATIAQELRLPLKAIVGWAGLLRTGQPVDVVEAAETIEVSAQAQTRLLEDVSDASRIVGGTLRIHPGPVDLAFVLRTSVEAVAPYATAKEVTVEVNIDCEPCLGHADAHRLEQVLSSLLSNAVQFTPEGGRVEVSLARRQNEIEFTMRDNGCGIRPGALPHLFDRLHRSDGSSGVRSTGLRLGLAVARHLVELHGGSIAAQSEGPGRGSTFSVRLPRELIPELIPERGDSGALAASE
jgi:signal transduction histidine kinase